MTFHVIEQKVPRHLMHVHSCLKVICSRTVFLISSFFLLFRQLFIFNVTHARCIALKRNVIKAL